MSIIQSIADKRDAQPLTRAQIDAFVQGVTDGSVGDEQTAAMLMAIRIRGMDARETADLSLAMAASGRIADLSAIPGKVVDKHSTGGVGDTTTLIAVPLAAACGAKVAKMSGRSLGHTGGTLDKLWSIPGLRTDFSIEELTALVGRVGCAVVGQTGELAPADKRLYAIRDITATVDSLPLIASSILSKKIAAGADAIVLDVKCGSGALMRTLEEARALARIMADIGGHAGRRIIAVITDMNQPLGTHVGNALEVREAVDVLAGRAGGPLAEVSLLLASLMARAAGIADEKSAGALVSEALRSGAGLAKLREMIGAQGGDARVADDPSLLPRAALEIPVLAEGEGYVRSTRCDAIGLAAQSLGAGRARKEESIDPAVGLVMRARIGDRVVKGQPLAILHAQDRPSAMRAAAMLLPAIEIGDAPPPTTQWIHEIIE